MQRVREFPRDVSDDPGTKPALGAAVLVSALAFGTVGFAALAAMLGLAGAVAYWVFRWLTGV